MGKLTLLSIIFLFSIMACKQGSVDENERRIENLISKMTLEEKIGQMNQISYFTIDDEAIAQYLAMYDRVEGFAETSPWILVDFYSPRRQLPGIQDFFNHKDLISNNGIKKSVFCIAGLLSNESCTISLMMF